jgi:hypothetical protein
MAGGKGSPGLPGFHRPQLSSEMETELEDAVKEKFKQKANDDAPDMEAPEYMKDSVEELQGEYWNQYDDHEKFKYAEKYDIIEPDVDVYASS